MKEQEGVLKEYDSDLMNRLVEKIVIGTDGKAMFGFYGGTEIEVEV